MKACPWLASSIDLRSNALFVPASWLASGKLDLCFRVRRADTRTVAATDSVDAHRAAGIELWNNNYETKRERERERERAHERGGCARACKCNCASAVPPVGSCAVTGSRSFSRARHNYRHYHPSYKLYSVVSPGCRIARSFCCRG